MSDSIDISALSASKLKYGDLFSVIGAVLMLVASTAQADVGPLVTVSPAGSQPSTTGPAE